MSLKDEFEIRECFEVEPGCPTLTVVWLRKETMLPWNRFTTGEYIPDQITLMFGDKLSVIIRGRDMDEIWRAAQMHDLRLIRASEEEDTGKCRILSISIEVPKDDDEIPY